MSPNAAAIIVKYPLIFCFLDSIACSGLDLEASLGSSASFAESCFSMEIIVAERAFRGSKGDYARE